MELHSKETWQAIRYDWPSKCISCWTEWGGILRWCLLSLTRWHDALYPMVSNSKPSCIACISNCYVFFLNNCRLLHVNWNVSRTCAFTVISTLSLWGCDWRVEAALEHIFRLDVSLENKHNSIITSLAYPIALLVLSYSWALQSSTQ